MLGDKAGREQAGTEQRRVKGSANDGPGTFGMAVQSLALDLAAFHAHVTVCWLSLDSLILSDATHPVFNRRSEID